MPRLKLVDPGMPAAVPAAKRALRPIVSYYYTTGKDWPIRVSHSSSVAMALRAAVTRIALGEKIRVVQVVDQHGNLKREVAVRYGRITINR
jgi:hypothetical protein